ncbi:MAG: hypothetical protein PHR30_18455 [Gallionellaceae bacterium]|nr:hypothetical protein [Gallionellaceae bacterium]
MFEVDGAADLVLRVRPGDLDCVVAAVARFRELIREAIRRGGCRSFVVGIHEEGAACDHEVRRD